MLVTYLAVLEDAVNEEGYWVYFPDVLGCCSYGSNIDEAKINAKEALRIHLEELLKDNDELPTANDYSGEGTVFYINAYISVPYDMEEVVNIIEFNDFIQNNKSSIKQICDLNTTRNSDGYVVITKDDEWCSERMELNINDYKDK